MNGERFLRDKARELIRAGRVPKILPDRVWGGAAFGGCCCMLCSTPVAPNEIALEVEFSSGAGSEGARGHFHSSCFLALELEILSARASEQPVSGNPASSAPAGSGTDGFPAWDGLRP